MCVFPAPGGARGGARAGGAACPRGPARSRCPFKRPGRGGGGSHAGDWRRSVQRGCKGAAAAWPGRRPHETKAGRADSRSPRAASPRRGRARGGSCSGRPCAGSLARLPGRTELGAPGPPHPHHAPTELSAAAAAAAAGGRRGGGRRGQCGGRSGSQVLCPESPGPGLPGSAEPSCPCCCSPLPGGGTCGWSRGLGPQAPVGNPVLEPGARTGWELEMRVLHLRVCPFLAQH